MAAKSNPGGLVAAIITCPGSFIATITHPTRNGYSQDKILRDRAMMGLQRKHIVPFVLLWDRSM